MTEPEGALVRREEREGLAYRHELSVEDLIAQVMKVQQVMKQVMTEGEHYGVIPGTGSKPTLLKPGAEKLCLLFRLDPQYDSVESREGEHLTVKSTCTLWHIPTGQRIGSGQGSCSTKESKYAYRKGSRKCPKCGREAIIKGKDEYGGGWLCFRKKEGCGEKFPDGDVSIEAQSTDRVPNDDLADRYNCVTPDTRLLTHDLRWVAAGDIKTGDVLIGVQEQMDDQYARHLATGEAFVYGRKEDLLYEVAFEDGRRVRCNGDHQWLVKKVGLKGTEWVATQDIHREISERQGRPRHWRVMSLCAPWTEDSTKEAGYIAGLLDADGSLGIGQLLVLFAQQPNVVLSKMETALEARGYVTGKSRCKTAAELARCESQTQVYGLRVLGGLPEQLRLLGSIRPPRLLERWLTRFDLSTRRLEGRGSGAGRPVRIKEVAITGMADVVLIGSSCGTYIAEGLVAHNTVLKMSNKRALVSAVLNATAASDIFTQDLEEMAENGRAAAGPPDTEPSQAPQVQQTPQGQRATKSAPASVSASPPVDAEAVISDRQHRMFWAVAHGHGWAEHEIRALLTEQGFHSSQTILAPAFDGLLATLKQRRKPAGG